jgi:uncharacterized RDD family membrane protein YckC
MTLEPKGQTDAGPRHGPELVLAKWSTRFWAWLVDFIIVTVAVELIFSIAYSPLAIVQGIENDPVLGAIRAATQSILFFAYWLYFESTTGQSVGKRLLKIKTADLAGSVADAKNVAIQSFGKSFLLPIDVLLGWIFTNDKRQRLLSRAANTIVIKQHDADPAANVSYRKD